MKKFLLSAASGLALMGSASAAELLPDFKGPVAPPFTWTAFYGGIHIGGVWGQKIWDDRNELFHSISYSTNGVLAGFQGGYNFQMGPVVLGGEFDLSWTNARGSGNIDFFNPIQMNETLGFDTFRTTISTDLNWFGTFAGRFAIAHDRLLLFLKAGVAVVGEEHTLGENVQYIGVEVPSSSSGIQKQTVRKSRGGYVLGFGAEYAVWQNWSAKLEYNYMDFGDKIVHFSTFRSEGVFVDQQVHAVKFGINYLFH